MRIYVNFQEKFFREILSEFNLSLKDLSRILGKNYSTFKKYGRGEMFIPKEVFEKLISMSEDPELWIKKSISLDDYWGMCKGGKKSSEGDKGHFKAQHARKFRNIKEVDPEIDYFFCEFYGILLGDGCITKFEDKKGYGGYVMVISGNKSLDSGYLKNLKDRIKQNWGINSYYYEYKDKNVCTLVIKNKSLARSLTNKYRFPLGLKKGNITIPKNIENLEWSLKKFVIRGLFDTDGSLYAKKSEDYRYPIISICSDDKEFRHIVYRILRNAGYQAYISSHNVCVRGIENAKKWIEDIGSSNKRNLDKFNYFFKNRNLIPKVKGL